LARRAKLTIKSPAILYKFVQIARWFNHDGYFGCGSTTEDSAERAIPEWQEAPFAGTHEHW